MALTDCSPDPLFVAPPAGNGSGDGGGGGSIDPGYDVEILVLCDDNGPFQRRVRFDATDGSFVDSTDFTLAGASYVPVGTVSVCPEGEGAIHNYVTDSVDVSGASSTFLPAGDLVSWTVRNRDSTTGTIQVNGGSVLPLDNGETMGSTLTGEDVNDVLNDTVVVDPGDGIVRVTTTRRA